MLHHYTHAPYCIITHMHHTASLRTCTMLLHYAVHHTALLSSTTRCFITHMHHAASLCTCTMLLHYAHAPYCIITHMHHVASLRSAPHCIVKQYNTLLHYTHAPCCFIMHMHHAASLRTCTMLLHYAHAPGKRNPVISVTQAVCINTLHTTQRATECKHQPTYELHKCNSNHAKRFTKK